VTGDLDLEDRRPEWTAAIKEMNTAVASDPDYLATILPIRDGVMVARRND
jgi:predicted O-methyltransferase YrrM